MHDIVYRYPVDRVPPRTILKRRQQPDVRPQDVTCPTAPDPASLLRGAPVLSCVPQHWTSPHHRYELLRCHVSHGSRPHLLAEVGSGATMCPSAPDLTSPHRRGELWQCHVSRSSRPCFPAREGSGVATHHMAPDSTSPRGESFGVTMTLSRP
jgi:hypothetical protein